VIHGIGYKINKTLYIQEIFSDELTNLSEVLKANGYTTFGVTSNYHLSEKFGFERGFDYFNSPPCLSADSVNKIIYSWKDEIKKSNKYFLWIHYFDPHYPYHPRTPWVEKYTSKALTRKLKLSRKETWEHVLSLIPMFQKFPRTLSNFIALYDSEINYVDHFIGEIIQEFEMNKNTLLIITADHGEEFLEHGYIGHGENLHRETIHIPLIVKLPLSKKKEIIENQVNLIDVMPTILQTLRIKPPEQTLGKSLLEGKEQISWLKENLFGKDLPHYNFSELDADLILKTIMIPEWKYIYNYKDKTEQLYNIKKDPFELNNLKGEKFEQINQLREQLLQWVLDSKKYPTKRNSFQLSPKEREQLKTLGYLK
jgi:arylsulfatase A-like enzyme